jgi:hypothetical protein
MKQLMHEDAGAFAGILKQRGIENDLAFAQERPGEYGLPPLCLR